MSKRLFDIVSAVFLSFVFAPLILFVWILVRVNLGSPAIFVQTRPGLGGRPFKVYKFRTMTNATNSDGALLSDHDRLTRFGKFLRASSLDELPELWNVIRGDMSLVGPRPLLMEYLPLYSPEQARRHEVRPGITGWAQVSGRNSVSWPEKFALDTWYVDNRTMLLDIKILWLTVGKVLRRDGISSAGEATAKKFRGNGVE
ncbi:sugar transferase [Rhodobacterales bacterium LSUCC0246]|nr:sugar transferase [Rhodobacterales bacterium LSUCC0374]